jgi:hypothetical protein
MQPIYISDEVVEFLKDYKSKHPSLITDNDAIEDLIADLNGFIYGSL